jgi:hypothetical protein
MPQRAPRRLALPAALSIALSLACSTARADDGTSPAPPAAPLPAPSTTASPVTPESPLREDSLTVGVYTCRVGEHAGMDADDAHTAADVICHALAARGAHPGAYDIRFGKLGTQLLLVVSERDGGDERRLFISGPEEVPVAADRLVAALVEGKSVEQTVTVDNVVSAETTRLKQKNVQAGATLSLSGQGALGTSATPSAGIEAGLQFRLHNLALVGQGRAGGVGSAGNLLGYASAGLGARYFLGDTDVAPFAGAGFMLAYFQQNEPAGPAYSGSGLGAYAEIGVALWRTNHVGALFSVRADVPTFSLESSSASYGAASAAATSSIYLVPVSANVGLSFQ